MQPAHLQSIVSEFNIKHDEWMYGPFAKLDAEAMAESVLEWHKKMAKLAKGLPREDLKGVASTLGAKLDEFKGCLGVVSCVCAPGMRARHWAALSELLGTRVSPDEDESLHTLLAHGVRRVERELQDLADAAAREHSLEKQLDRMQADWVRAALVRDFCFASVRAPHSSFTDPSHSV